MAAPAPAGGQFKLAAGGSAGVAPVNNAGGKPEKNKPKKEKEKKEKPPPKAKTAAQEATQVF